MAHMNSYPYPLSFPNEEQLVPISPYSSLANALGPDPVYAGQQVQRPPPTNGDAVVDNQAIYLSTLPVSNPSYPYPVRNVLKFGAYPVRTSLSASCTRSSGDAKTLRDENSGQNGLHMLPVYYDHMPQQGCGVHQGHADLEFPAIHFFRKGNTMPYSVWDLLSMNTLPDLVAGDLPILLQTPDRWIKIRLTWPGYPRHSLEKRVYIKGPAPSTPNLLLTAIAYHVHEFVRYIQNEGAVVEPGQEQWTITEMSMGAPALWKNCIITALQHVDGSVWQPVIYCPRG